MLRPSERIEGTIAGQAVVCRAYDGVNPNVPMMKASDLVTEFGLHVHAALIAVMKEYEARGLVVLLYLPDERFMTVAPTGEIVVS